MPNWCFTHYAFQGDKQEIADMYAKLKSASETDEPSIKNDFGKEWLSNVVTLFGGDTDKIECNGDFTGLTLKNETTITLESDTAWRDCSELWDFVLENYPSVKRYFLSVEPDTCYFVTNDAQSRHFRTKYVINQQDGEDGYCDSRNSLIEEVAERTGEAISNVEELDEAIERYNKLNNGDDYIRYNPVKII